ncbi:hypothetical protein ETB97_004761 [Aspergillus alliaceus]|uniref:Uncharacterized protein n=1 Tax=Petromyces alliaceus TaxID=209559 RepID=A0A8H5ZYJ4_PETAA|nr:hypothetical protein ETB97_004761 [Aspergillus burnettii]
MVGQLTRFLQMCTRHLALDPDRHDHTWRPGNCWSVFNTILKKHDWFAGKTGSALDNAKDTAMTLIVQSTTIAKDALPGGDAASWKPEKQDEFSAYLGQIVYGWANITSLALKDLFSGSDVAIDALWQAMSDGKLIEGKKEGDIPATGNAQNEVLANTNKCIIGFALPALWRQSGSYTFIIDAGHACNEDKDLSDYS